MSQWQPAPYTHGYVDVKVPMLVTKDHPHVIINNESFFIPPQQRRSHSRARADWRYVWLYALIFCQSGEHIGFNPQCDCKGVKFVQWRWHDVKLSPNLHQKIVFCLCWLFWCLFVSLISLRHLTALQSRVLVPYYTRNANQMSPSIYLASTPSGLRGYVRGDVWIPIVLFAIWLLLLLVSYVYSTFLIALMRLFLSLKLFRQATPNTHWKFSHKIYYTVCWSMSYCGTLKRRSGACVLQRERVGGDARRRQYLLRRQNLAAHGGAAANWVGAAAALALRLDNCQRAPISPLQCVPAAGAGRVCARAPRGGRPDALVLARPRRQESGAAWRLVWSAAAGAGACAQ